jgi:hypothetical protein
MTDTNPFRSIANPRRITLAATTDADVTAPDEQPGLTMLGGDAAACADGACSVSD